MYKHLDHIIRQVLLQPEIAVGGISMVDEMEERVLLHEFNAPIGEIKENNILYLLDQALKDYAGRTAVISSEGSLSYEEIAVHAAGGGRAGGRGFGGRGVGGAGNSLVGLMIGRSSFFIPTIRCA